MKLVIIVLLVTFIGLNAGCRNYKSDVAGEIIKQTWRKKIVIEQLSKQIAEAWETDVPKDAKIIFKHQEVHHYDGKVLKSFPETQTETVQCGFLPGSGKGRPIPKYCEKKYTIMVSREVDDISKPVYATKITYEFEDWTEKENRDIGGDGQDYSELEKLALDNKTTRIGKSTDIYWITIKLPDGSNASQMVSKQEYDRSSKGQLVKCQIDLNKYLSDCQL